VITELLSKVLSFPQFRKRGIDAMPEIECLGCGGVTKFALVKTDQNTPTITLRGLVSCPGGRIETISHRRTLGSIAQREILEDKVRNHNPEGIREWPVTIRSSGKGSY
jgi:hypothetical protein